MSAMSSDRSNNRPLKPSVATNRGGRTPVTPRVAGSGTAGAPSKPLGPRVAARSVVNSPSIRVAEDRNDGLGSGNVTPRSAVRVSRVENAFTPPTVDDRPRSSGKSQSVVGSNAAPHVRGAGTAVGGSLQARGRLSRPVSFVEESGSVKAPTSARVRSPAFGQSDINADPDSRFFHASDAQKQDAPVKKVEAKKAPAFFYADGQEDKVETQPSVNGGSSIRSAPPERAPFTPNWFRPDAPIETTKSPPVLSPALSTLSGNSPYFAAAVNLPSHHNRSPSPSKENIHLSYRRGASQIFGTRPAPKPSTPATIDESSILPTNSRRSSFGPSTHRKSPSLSSIDSGNSHQSRGRPTPATIDTTISTPLSHSHAPPLSPPAPRLTSPVTLPSINTSLASPPLPQTPGHDPSGLASPTKAIADLAADARRERKVLDLEISNSSLLAINASLEREVRRQKAELKRYRRLSRAGHLDGFERSARLSEGLESLGEGGDAGSEEGFGGLGMVSEGDEDEDEEEEEEGDGSGTGDGEGGGGEEREAKERDRLAKDEKRLRVDLERHKELLVQSQMMNQSLKRCMYATEEMIREANKALHYHVRVSDVKLGGRVLTGNDEEDEEGVSLIERDGAEDSVVETAQGQGSNLMESAKDVLDVWSGIGRSKKGGSEISADRDSGIEVDKITTQVLDVIPPHPGMLDTAGHS